MQRDQMLGFPALEWVTVVGNEKRQEQPNACEEQRVLADELLREVDAALIDVANGSTADALEHLCVLERALVALRLTIDGRTQNAE
jgi:hypothetical protein